MNITDGNLTKVVSYGSVTTTSVGDPVTRKFEYDAAGNLIKVGIVCSGDTVCEQKQYSYTDATQYAYPTIKTSGAVSDQTQQTVTSTAYDFNTGLVLSEADANGRTYKRGYSLVSWRVTKETAPTGANVVTDYLDADLKIEASTYASAADGGPLAGRSTKHYNGLGKLRREESLGAGGFTDVVETKYDQLGRMWKQTQPFRSTTHPDQWKWGENFYDALGRVYKTKAPDGSESHTYFNETARPGAASAEPGQTVRVGDAWARERWSRTNAFGLVVEVVEPDPAGGGSVLGHGGARTSYTYDTLFNLVEVLQGAQQRSFRYDAIGRLLRQKQAEAKATLDDSGAYLGASATGARWSDVYTYDARSNLVASVDARGVKTVFSYDVDGDPNKKDPLNRVQSISYDLSNAGGGETIAAAPGVSFQYRVKGSAADLVDLTQIKRVTAAAVNTEEYEYDAEGRVRSKEVVFLSRQAYPMTTNYVYDSLSRVKDRHLPSQYGMLNAPRKHLQEEYEAGGVLSRLTVDDVEYASGFSYDPSNRIKSLKVGPAGSDQVTESYNYDPVTDLLVGQTAVRASGATLLDLSYDYLRPGASAGRTGQLTRISNNLDHTRDRDYEYDALGRLRRASAGDGGGTWAQRYLYDRYGNRQSVLSQKTSSFVADLYVLLWARQPDAGGLQARNDALRQAYAQGQTQFLASARQTVADFFSSTEYTSRGRSDREFVYDLYRAYLNREPDQGGWDAWTAAIGPHGRPAVMQGFANSAEFANRVSGLYPGAVSASGSSSLSGLTVTIPPGGGPVTLNWAGVAGAVKYRVERSTNKNWDGPTAFTTAGSSATYTDSATNPGTAYLYRVCAADPAGGCTTGYSNIALATPFGFADDPIITHADDPTGATVTAVKAIHLIQLRKTVNAVRALAGLGLATWTDADDVLTSVYIQAVHIRELRIKLDEALRELRLPVAGYTDDTLLTGAGGTVVQRVHFAELRQRSTRGSGTASGGGGGAAAPPVPRDGFESLSFDSATNRINSAGWEYDAAGNLTRARTPYGWQRFAYDAAGRMVAVKSDAHAVVVSHTYGSTRERLISHEGARRTYYVWEGEQVAAEYVEDETSPSSPKWNRSYIYAGDRLLATHEAAAPGAESVQYHHPDRLGTRVVTSAGNASHFNQDTLPFGTDLPSESTGGTNRRFTSYDRDFTTGTDYAVNRFYSPLQGRFTQPDPLGADAAELGAPQSWNSYAYCQNDPINRTDPDGLFGFLFPSVFTFGIGFGFGGGVPGFGIRTMINGFYSAWWNFGGTRAVAPPIHTLIARPATIRVTSSSGSASTSETSAPTVQPCPVAKPTDSIDRIVFAGLWGEVSSVGDRQYGTDQWGSAAYGKPNGSIITYGNVYMESVHMLIVLINRVREWPEYKGKTLADATTANDQVYGYKLSNLEVGFGNVGSESCFRAIAITQAIGWWHRFGHHIVDDPIKSKLFFWRGVPQHKGKWVRKFNPGDIRWANTDFMEKNPEKAKKGKRKRR